MFGYKVRIFYKDIQKMCTNCFKSGHLRKDCNNEPKKWIHHVVDFITDNEQIDEDDFGFWMSKSRDYVNDNPELFNCPDQLNMDDLEISDSEQCESDDESDNNTVVGTANSPRVLETDPITSVQNAVETIETKNSSSQKSPHKKSSKPTSEPKKPRGRPPKN